MERHLLVFDTGQKLEIKSVTDKWAVIRGYGVVFQGKDKTGDTFLSLTDYELKRLIGTPVYIEHTLTGITEAIGEIINYVVDEIGILVEAKVDRTKDVVQEYLAKITKGLVGWSSGSAGHLVRRVKNIVTKWPIVEMSLTTKPAEPRTIKYGLQQIKSENLLSSLETEQENSIEAKENSLTGFGVTINTKIIIR